VEVFQVPEVLSLYPMNLHFDSVLLLTWCSLLPVL